jgi:uncharacterized membrane protein
MNSPQLHLLLTHLPVIGTLFALCLLLYGLVRCSEELKRAALLAFVIAGAIAIPAYMTGEPAAEHLKKLLLGKVLDATDQHEEIAAIALAASLLLGLLSLGALLYFRKGRRLSRKLITVIFLIGLVDTAILAWTAHLGAAIRHPEIRSGAEHQ